MRIGLRVRLLLPPAVLLVGIAAVTWWAVGVAAHTVERQIDTQIRAIARTLSGPPTFPLTDAVLNQMKGLSGVEFVLVNRTGERLSTFPNANIPLPTNLGLPLRIGDSEFLAEKVTLRAPHPNEGGTLWIFYPDALRRTAVGDAVRPALWLGGVGGLVVVGLTMLTSRRLVTRVRDLEQRTRDIAAGAFAPMPLPKTDDELRDLCQSVNEMARRLADYREQTQTTERLRVLGQFSGGLAHQLRNAATGAKLAIELYLGDTSQRTDEPLHVALRQLARIEFNLRQFLNLGKPAQATAEPCDLHAILDQTVRLVGPQSQHLGTTITWERPTFPAVIAGDPNALGHLFANLIANAIEATSSGGNVSVTSAIGDDGRHRIEVRDDGPGPRADIAAKLFEPFVTGKEQGIGLGLAVARQAAEAHGGTLAWERRGTETVFRVDWPHVRGFAKQ